MRLPFHRLLTAVALFAAAPAVAAPVPAAGPNKPDDPLPAARRALDAVTDLDYQGRSLNDVAADLRARTKLAVTIDPAVFQFGLDPNQPVVTATAKGVKLRDGLRTVLAPFNLRAGLVRDGLFISTEDGLTTRQLRQRVSVDCDGTPFATAAKQLATDTGVNLVLDPRLKDKGAAAVTLKLDDVPLESAVRLLAEVADLRVVRMSNVLFVTTPERADKLRADADGPTQGGQAVPAFPGTPETVPGVIGVPLPAAPNAPLVVPVPPPPPPLPAAPGK